MSERAEWLRLHADGSMGVVRALSDGTAEARYLARKGSSPGRHATAIAFLSIEEACAENDAEARRQGHVCTERCGPWIERDERR